MSDRITYIDTIITPYLVIDPGAENEETVEIIAKAGNRLTVIRGVA